MIKGVQITVSFGFKLAAELSVSSERGLLPGLRSHDQSRLRIFKLGYEIPPIPCPESLYLSPLDDLMKAHYFSSAATCGTEVHIVPRALDLYGCRQRFTNVGLEDEVRLFL